MGTFDRLHKPMPDPVPGGSEPPPGGIAMPGATRPSGSNPVPFVFVPEDYPEVDWVADRDDLPALTGWGAEVCYEFDAGIRHAPVAGRANDRPVAFWRTHSGCCVKVVRWVVQAIGGVPELPSPDTGSANEVLIAQAVSPAVPSAMPMGDQVWTVAGVYRYALQKAPAAGDRLGTGASPLLDMPASANRLDISHYRTLLDAAQVATFDGRRVDY